MYRVVRENKKNLFLYDDRLEGYMLFIYKDGVWCSDNESMPFGNLETVYVGNDPFKEDEHFFDNAKPIEDDGFSFYGCDVTDEDKIITIYCCNAKFYKFDCGIYWELARCVFDDMTGDIITVNQLDELPGNKTKVWEGTIDDFDRLQYDSLCDKTPPEPKKTEINIDKKHKMIVEDGKVYVVAKDCKTPKKTRNLCKLSGILAYLLNRHPKVRECLAFKQSLLKNHIIERARTVSGYQVLATYGRYNLFYNTISLIENLRKYL